MDHQWAKVQFDVSSRILGCNVEFHDGSAKRLNAKQAQQKVFREVRTSKLFDAAQMISSLLMRTNTRKQDFVKPAAVAEALQKGVCVGKPALDMSFTPGSVALRVGKNSRDIRRIVFDVELTVRQKKSS